MIKKPQVIIVGAGILGLASAYHLLRDHPDLDLLVVERLPGPGRGNTARSAAAYRDMFSSPVNRRLSQGSIAFYNQIRNQSFPLNLKDIGYLWLLRSAQMDRIRAVLSDMAQSAVKFKILNWQELTDRLSGFTARDITGGVLGKNCGILNANQLTGYYEKESRRLGAKFVYNQEVTGFSRNHQGQINGIITAGYRITADSIIVATGAWMSSTLAWVDLKVPVTPVKRQLFAVSAGEPPQTTCSTARDLMTTIYCPWLFCRTEPISGRPWLLFSWVTPTRTNPLASRTSQRQSRSSLKTGFDRKLCLISRLSRDFGPSTPGPAIMRITWRIAPLLSTD